MGLFLDTTQIAIKEMMEEFGAPSRFGRVFSEEDLEAAAARLAAFFEMTLDLRASVGKGAPLSSPAEATAPERSSRPGRPSYVRPAVTSLPPGGQTSQRSNTLNTVPRRGGLGLSAGFVEPSLEAASERSGGLLGRLGFPRTKAAAEVVAQAAASTPTDSERDAPRFPPQQDFRLPRKRVDVSEADRDAFERTRRGG